MADKRINPIITLKRKELEASERRLFLQRQELRLVELDDEKAIISENIEAARAQIVDFETEIAELKKISA